MLPRLRRTTARLARPLLAVVLAVAQLAATVGVPVPAARAPEPEPDSPLAPEPPAPLGACGAGACCCAPAAGACACCAPLAPAADHGGAARWAGGTFAPRCCDHTGPHAVLAFQIDAAPPEPGAAPCPRPARAFVPAPALSLPRTAARPPVPPPRTVRV